MSHRDSLGATALTFLGACLGLGLLAACAEPPPSAPTPTLVPIPAPDPQPLQGYWQGVGDSNNVRLTFEGSSLHFYSRDDFQYEATFTLAPGTDPAELHAIIVDSPRTVDSAGELVVAVYEFEEDGTLDLAVIDESDGAPPPSFDQGIGRYHLERVQAR